ncbi:hypothetical protein [Alkalihalobacillus deserti]|uniref:hypothetical protein n=1 Tax=Alkalihalobacillus deserti TaxID=2879466 RepID=UPI001D154FCB|nr:hypothetical protein [Alkalihalobacillus deserti]
MKTNRIFLFLDNDVLEKMILMFSIIKWKKTETVNITGFEKNRMDSDDGKVGSELQELHSFKKTFILMYGL